MYDKPQIQFCCLLVCCCSCRPADSSGSDKHSLLRTGARGRTDGFLTERPSFPAVFPQPGCLFLRAALMSYTCIGLPAALLPASVPTVLAVLLTESGVGLPAPSGALQLHQLTPPATGRLALPAVTLRGGRPAVAVPKGAESRPAAGVPWGPAATARAGGGRSGTGGESSRDARGTSQPGRCAGVCTHVFG